MELKLGDLLLVREDTYIPQKFKGKPALLLQKIANNDWRGDPFMEYLVLIDGEQVALGDYCFAPMPH